MLRLARLQFGGATEVGDGLDAFFLRAAKAAPRRANPAASAGWLGSGAAAAIVVGAPVVGALVAGAAPGGPGGAGGGDGPTSRLNTGPPL